MRCSFLQGHGWGWGWGWGLLLLLLLLLLTLALPRPCASFPPRGGGRTACEVEGAALAACVRCV